VLPLAAAYLCYLAGASVEALVDESEAKARRDILITALLFVAGFSTVFVGLGARRRRWEGCSGNGAMRYPSRPGSG
jgi:cytochrome c biogenesis protein CcdA